MCILWSVLKRGLYGQGLIMEVKRVSSNKTLNTYEKKLSREVKCVTMSRSYKHTPVYKVGSITKFAKRQANKKIRRSAKGNPEKVYSGKSNHYRRENESWDIWDYRFWGEPIWRQESSFNIAGNLWEKCYKRK